MVTAPRWPDVFLVGAPRCGTTAMYTALKQHPEIFTAVHKEPHFFGSDLTPQPHTVRDVDLYLDLFADAEPAQRAVDGSVWALRSTRAADEIAARRPDARIIVMLRDPVELVRSLHGLFVRTGNEDQPDLAAALALEPRRRAGEAQPEGVYFPEGLLYTEAARFAPGLKRFRRALGAERVHVVLFDDFAADPVATSQGVYAFLGVAAGFAPAGDPDVARRAVRPQALSQLRRLRRRAPALVRLLGSRTRTHGGARSDAPPAVLDALRVQFTDDLRETAELIGRDLSHWCTPTG